MLDPVHLQDREEADVVRAALDGLEAGKLDIVVDDGSAKIEATPAGDPADVSTTAAAD